MCWYVMLCYVYNLYVLNNVRYKSQQKMFNCREEKTTDSRSAAGLTYLEQSYKPNSYYRNIGWKCILYNMSLVEIKFKKKETSIFCFKVGINYVDVE